MTRLFEIIQRCPKCGYNRIYHVDWNELQYFNMTHSIFNQSLCAKCSPQKRLIDFT